MKLITIMDNVPGAHKALRTEHGLSFYVETESVRILFDFGAGENALYNAGKLGIHLEEINYAVGSHGHYDHGGGYRDFVEAGLTCPLVTGAGYFEEKYARDGLRVSYLGTGFGAEYLEKKGITHVECSGVLELAEGCWVIGNIKRSREFETVPERFVLRDGAGWKQDFFRDEICLAVEVPGGVGVILGCSHPGVLNMLDTVKEALGRPIRFVAGGTHLVKADRDRIEKTAEEMKKMGVRQIGFNHCSGNRLRELLEEEKELDTVYLGAGDCLFW
ncbi:MAG: MBL fold metallo-hydrolase [Lachnospiraceae bacterium]|nr:MBL fold metallo-hydrolase [Lachnospiraceae bacterium]